MDLQLTKTIQLFPGSRKNLPNGMNNENGPEGQEQEVQTHWTLEIISVHSNLGWDYPPMKVQPE